MGAQKRRWSGDPTFETRKQIPPPGPKTRRSRSWFPTGRVQGSDRWSGPVGSRAISRTSTDPFVATPIVLVTTGDDRRHGSGRPRSARQRLVHSTVVTVDYRFADMADTLQHPLPRITSENRHFWTGGADGRLQFLRCQDCGNYIHPPIPICRVCLSRNQAVEAVSGQGRLFSFTINHQVWFADLAVPYNISLVEIVEQPSLRLTTTVVDCALEDIHIGMPVRVNFSSGTTFTCLSSPQGRSEVEIGERDTIVSGIGQSEAGRHLPRGELDLTIEACQRAISDAGLTRDDIDGLTTFMGPSTSEVQDALGLKLRYHDGGLEGPAQIKPIINAALAVATGQARHVLSYRTVMMLGGGGGSGGVERVGGPAQWTLPFGTYAATNWIAWYGQRFMHERGMTREQLAWIALTERRNAGHNPLAIYREPMTMDDYMNVRMVSTPLCLYDCDVPVNGSVAVVISHKDYAEDTPQPACNIEAISAAISARPSWDQWERMALWDCAANLWTRTDLKAADVDVAELYDGFSTITIEWLEALGFCPRRGRQLHRRRQEHLA